VEETNNVEGNGSIKMGVFKIGGGANSVDSNSFVNRIKFSVPVIFPFQQFVQENED
jgi:hypothetical protein